MLPEIPNVMTQQKTHKEAKIDCSVVAGRAGCTVSFTKLRLLAAHSQRPAMRTKRGDALQYRDCEQYRDCIQQKDFKHDWPIYCKLSQALSSPQVVETVGSTSRGTRLNSHRDTIPAPDRAKPTRPCLHPPDRGPPQTPITGREGWEGF